jgi:hypothetical protein
MYQMKNQMKSFALGAYRFNSKAANAMIAVKGGTPLVKVFVSLLTPLGLGVTSSRVLVVVVLLRRFYLIYKGQGVRGLVLYLKTTTVVFQQCVNGHRLTNVSPVSGVRVSRTNTGYPRIIPLIHREMIRQGDTKLMKLYLTLFNLYRVLEFDGRLKLNTITAPSTATGRLDMTKHIESFVSGLKLDSVVKFDMSLHIKNTGMFHKRMLPNFVLDWLKNRYEQLEAFPILKGAPGTHTSSADESLSYSVSTHPVVLTRSAISIRGSSFYTSFLFFINLMPNNNKIRVAFEAASTFSGLKPLPSLGKLGTKVEAAGKIRVFAMVDAWTQWIMSPIHELYFAILRKIPQDGTFDQLRPLGASKNWKDAFSLDLTAATDRLPLNIQVDLLAAITGSRGLALSWAKILVDRDYFINYSKAYGGKGIDKYRDHGPTKRVCSFSQTLRYAVGQPMGALSSWASLAITHHYLVQYSAWEAGVARPGVWFKDYAILGDDLVIGNRLVAIEYLRVLKDIGMEVGLHKSLISGGNLGLEFAKRTFHKGEDISPIPLTEFAAALGSISEMRSFALKFNLGFPALVKTLGYKFRVLGSLSKRFSLLNARIKIVFLATNLPFDEGSVLEFFRVGSALSALYKIDILAIAKKFQATEFLKLAKSALRVITGIRGGSHIYNLGYHPFEALIVSSMKFLLPSRFIEVNSTYDLFGPKGPDTFVMLNYTPPVEELEYVPFEDSISSSESNMKIKDSWPWKAWTAVLGTYVDALVIPSRSKILGVLEPFSSGWIPAMVGIPNDFAAMYMLYLESAREAAKASPSSLSLGKVLAPERGGDPVQIKLWRRWSSVLQGTQLLNSRLATSTNKELGKGLGDKTP